ncbi:chromate efflux transporter [Photobacterium carnosum]|uniref:chromate efflux transporter n=1 Tax=Photobacterium carnosum TaxID=2023717 RepID=UPI001E35F91B|nr:chromate efflux transporter [Photobacterium carnosum]MCD9544749.1 chromate efflux transporter [Photobacterium carnosum]MCD9548947.1 chromate efflux transporter [Photobacterium carnosum]MCF2305885.1 chromate efflux transporter [Photobacterium carnosum]
MITVFWQFLILGLCSFGGPAAHIGYFQQAFVVKKKWLSDKDFTQAIALCQFLPGPASSQLGMYIGYKKAGYLGSIAAFIGFTLPSFSLLTFLAIANNTFGNSVIVEHIITAAKLLAVVVIADALWGMAKKSLTSIPTVATTLLTMIWLMFSHGLLGQIIPIVVASLIGYLWSFKVQTTIDNVRVKPIRPHMGLLSVFVGLFILLPLMPATNDNVKLLTIFYQAGSFVFGGGHVVLPLLQPMLAGMVTDNTFLSAYASAQLVPGPMFTMASYLGASAMPTMPIWGSLVATIAVFLPGSLLLFAFLPAWKALFSHPRLIHAIVLINACVVGLLGYAFINPVIISSIKSIIDIIAVIVGYILIKKYQSPVWVVAILLFLYVSIINQ